MSRVVFVTPEGLAALEAREGESLLEAAARGAGLIIDAPCGGRGRCGKCLVRVKEGALEPPDEAELRSLGPRAGSGLRLACLARVPALPAGAELVVEPLVAPGGFEIAVHGPRGGARLEPLVWEERVEVDPPRLGDRRGDLERLMDALRSATPAGTELKARPLPEPGLALLRELPRMLRRPEAPESAPVPLAALCSPSSLVALRPPRSDLRGGELIAAVDIGTTTVVVQLIEGSSGASLGLRSALNAQRSAGADVVTRIQYCAERPKGLSELSARIVRQIEGMVRALCDDAGREAEEVAAIVAAGNCTMLHILAAVEPAAIAAAPFSPAFVSSRELAAAELGFELFRATQVFLLPAVSAYVGADIVAGLVAAGIDRREGEWLYLDLGTNGEIALGGREGVLCCATAAGPAFEGAHIECGSASVAGAISEVRLEAGELALRTIGGAAAPQGICGSGILDAAALLVRGGAVDATGRLLEEEEAGGSGWPDGGAAARALLAHRDKAGPEGRLLLVRDGSVYLTQRDLREVQLASAAIAAGVDVLLAKRGIEARQLAGVVLAGGFGSYLDPESAMDLGLLPSDADGSVTAVGNASLAGAARCALSRRDFARADELARRMEYVELSSSPEFQERYIERMLFPEPRRPA